MLQVLAKGEKKKRICEECRVKGPAEAGRAYARRNRERLRVAARMRYHSDPEKQHAVDKIYRQANPEQVRKTQRAWAKANPEKRRACGRRRRAAKRGAYRNGQIDEARLYKLAKYRCQMPICIMPTRKLDMEALPRDPMSPTPDHIHPLADGGPDVMSNLRAAHYGCNSARCTKAQGENRHLEL